VPAVYLLRAVVALALLLPEAFLVLQARDAGWSQVHRVLFRPLSGELLRNTVELTVLAAAATAVIGTAAAWCVVRTALPLRRMWDALVVLPISIPDFIVGYARHSLSPGFIGLRAAAVVMLFFPLALVCLRASAQQASPALAGTGRSLGCRPAAVFVRVTLPLILPGVGAALCLVFLSCVTELTATLVLVPTDVQTLVTQFWAYQTNTAYGAAAPYAVTIMLLAAVPNLVVAAWFGRRRGGPDMPCSRRDPRNTGRSFKSGRGHPGIRGKARPRHCPRSRTNRSSLRSVRHQGPFIHPAAGAAGRPRATSLPSLYLDPHGGPNQPLPRSGI
jgi:iron(III) transport system permease protein